MKLRDLSLVRKLTFILALNAALAVLTTAGLLLVRHMASEYGDARDRLQAIAGVVGENSRAALAFDDADNARATLQALREIDEIVAARLYNRQNRLLAEYRSVRSHYGGSGFMHDLIDTWLPVDLLLTQVIGDEDDSTAGRIELEAHLTAVWHNLLHALAISLMVALGMIALTTWIGLRLRALIADPILTLAEVSHRITLGKDYSLRAPKTSQDEIGALTDDFNRMLDEIQQRDDALRLEREMLEQRVAERTAALQQAMEAAQDARAEAERANAAKSEFLSRMSHELRTPLNVILGFAQMLAMPGGSSLTAQQADNVQEILKAGQHLLGQVNEVLDLARIESGRIELVLEDVDLLPATASCIAQLRPIAAARNIVMSSKLAAGLVVRGDAIRVKQVLINLLSNAIKYNRDNGQIDVTACVEQGRVRVAVRDTGRGIAPERMSSLFKPFERLESSYDGIEGTGIGLALVKRLVEAMGGEIGVDSAEGGGSTFWFALSAPETKVGAGETAQRRPAYSEGNAAH